MKKAKKILLTVLPVMMLALMLFVSFGSNVLASSSSPSGTNGISTEFPGKQDEIDSVNTMTNRIWGTVLTVLQILAFAAVVIAGVRYMFASADQKADIKKGLVYLVLGAILVFASSTIVKFIVNATEQAVPTSKVSIVREIENA